MNKHTQGPWHNNRADIFQGGKKDRLIAFCGYGATNEIEANARLIAAAPELLEALTNLMKRAASYAEKYAPEGNEPIWAFINDASDILNRVKGE